MTFTTIYTHICCRLCPNRHLYAPLRTSMHLQTPLRISGTSTHLQTLLRISGTSTHLYAPLRTSTHLYAPPSNTYHHRMCDSRHNRKPGLRLGPVTACGVH